MWRAFGVLVFCLTLPNIAMAIVVPAPALSLGCGVLTAFAPDPAPAFHEGTRVQRTQVGTVKIPKGAQVYQLGVGAEAETYRVIPTKGASYVLRLQNQDPEIPLAVYKRQMGFLAEALSDEESGDPLPGDKSFKVVAIDATADAAVGKLGDVRGWTLEDLIDRAGADSTDGKKLIALFNARCLDLSSRITSVAANAKSSPMQGMTDSGIRYEYYIYNAGQTIPGTPWAVSAGIRWKNVIVDPNTFEMTIIDPH